MKVIVAIDQTDSADQILDAVSMAHWPDHTEFKIVTVIQPLQWEAVPCIEWNKEAGRFFQEREKLAEEAVRRAKKHIRKACPDCKVHAEVRTGNPREEITTLATEWMADRIIIGAHGSAPNRFFHGSVARSVSQYCGCSIQLVRLKPVAAVDEHASASKRTVGAVH